MVASKRSSFELSQKGAWISISTYTMLTAAKLAVGFLSGSQAITADGLNNATDVLGSIAVLYGLKIAQRPADDDHRYGHERAEGVAALVVATIMGLVSIQVGLSAIQAIFAPAREAPAAWSAWVALGAAAVMLAVYAHNLSLAKRSHSKALEAAAQDNKSDTLTSLGAAAGIFGAQAGWAWADPLAGLIVAVLIARTAWRIGTEAAHMLMDGFADIERVKALRRQVKQVEGVTKVRSIRCRHLGLSVAVDVTVAVPGHLSVIEAHEVADRVEATLHSQEDIEEVQVHIEPDAVPSVG
ncbi:MAG: cation diffusion facilitator family transporter [Bacillota bacterium]